MTQNKHKSKKASHMQPTNSSKNSQQNNTNDQQDYPSKPAKPFRPASFASPAKIALVGAVFAVIGAIFIFSTFALQKEPSLDRAKYINDPQRGVIWDGLVKSDPNGPCRGQLEVNTVNANATDKKARSCTHGPDPAPKGKDVRKRVEPLRTGEEDGTAAAPGGGGGGGGGKTPPPSPVACDGDGVSGNRVQVMYAHASDKPNRYSQYLPSIQAWASGVNNIFIESGLQTGSARNVRFVHDANCLVTVANVTLDANGDDTMGITEDQLQFLGHDRPDRKYLIWMDANIFCGQGDIRWDDNPGVGNGNNYGRSWARVDNGCWDEPRYAAHELMHTLGGVQMSAPHSTGYWHCTDDYDAMCYQDNETLPGWGGYAQIVCTNSALERLFDCNDDDYFHTGTPAAGSYLDTHWNAANNVFLITPPSAGSDTEAPVVTISQPSDGAVIGSKTTISATATDNVKVTKMEIWIDGQSKATSTSGTISYSWSSRTASSGTHVITVKAFDAVQHGLKTVNVTKN